jgi:hypothetical protein
MKNIIAFILFVFFGSVAHAAVCNNNPRDEACWTLMIMNVQHDSSNPLMAELGREPTNEVRHSRINNLGPSLMAAYQKGKGVKAAGKRDFLVYVWGKNPTAAMAYKVVGRGTQPVTSSFEEVTGKVKNPVFKSGSDLGAPAKVYRVTANDIAMGLQFPWETLEGATILVRVDGDTNGVYPQNDGKVMKGLWVVPGQLKIFRENKVTGSLMPFVSSR